MNHELPSKIIIFRDGVGDGQLAVVAEYEQAQFTSCFSHFGPDYEPKLTIVVVQKRINTRIFGVLVSSSMKLAIIRVIVYRPKQSQNHARIFSRVYLRGSSALLTLASNKKRPPAKHRNTPFWLRTSLNRPTSFMKFICYGLKKYGFFVVY